MSTGAELIAQERARQIEEEGYTQEHDAHHTPSEFVNAAIAYASQGSQRFAWWPWHPKGFKPSPGNRRQELVKAGALIAAAIDAMERD